MNLYFKIESLFWELFWEATESYMTSGQKNHILPGAFESKVRHRKVGYQLRRNSICRDCVAEKTIMPFQYEPQVELMVFKPQLQIRMKWEL